MYLCAKRLWSAVPWHRFEGGGKPPHSEGRRPYWPLIEYALM